MKEILVDKIQTSGEVPPALILDVSAVGKPGMIRTQMGNHNRSVMVAVYGMPCSIPPCKK
jgi:hypothetical protein